jgi:hypothetical protein
MLAPRRPQRWGHPAYPRAVSADAPAIEPSPAGLPETRPLKAASGVVGPRRRLQTVTVSRPQHDSVLSKYGRGDGGGKNNDGAQRLHPGHWLSPHGCREKTVRSERRSDIQSKMLSSSRAQCAAGRLKPRVSAAHNGLVANHPAGLTILYDNGCLVTFLQRRIHQQQQKFSKRFDDRKRDAVRNSRQASPFDRVFPGFRPI